MFLKALTAGRLQEAARWVSTDMVFLGRAPWSGEATPFREDAVYVAKTLVQMNPQEVASLGPKQQAAAFEVPVADNELVFFAIIKAGKARATLGITVRQGHRGFLVCRVFDPKNVKSVVLASDRDRTFH